MRVTLPCASGVLRSVLIVAVLALVPCMAHADDLLPAAVRRLATGDGVATNWYQSLLGEFLRLQRDINRALTAGVTALKDGAAAGPLLTAMAIGFLYGAFHAAGPGHGKAVVVSYFLSRDASWLRGVWMGGQIALFHVLSALVVVLVVHSLLEISVTRPIDQLQSLKVVSYGAITVIGVVMLIAALRRAFGAAPAELAEGDCGHGHRHGETSLLSMAIGVIPCSGAVLVLVYALANDILISGILMTLCIAAGMALTLTAIGVATVLLRQRAIGQRASSTTRSWLRTCLGIFGPAAITIFGGLLLLVSLMGPTLP